MKWEYWVVNEHSDDSIESVCEMMNRCGRDGWEFVSVGSHSYGGDTAWLYYYFKRPLRDK